MTVLSVDKENDIMLCDVNDDGKINVTDIAMIAAHIKGIKAITQ